MHKRFPASASREMMAAVMVVFVLTLSVAQSFVEPTSTTAATALTNWQSALISFKKAGATAAENKFVEARAQLTAASTNLSPPYNAMAAQFAGRLDSIATNRAAAKSPERMKALTDLCADLRAYDAALKLQAANTEPDELADDPTYAWRLFETGKTAAAITEYRRKVMDEGVQTFAEYYKDQIKLGEQRAANSNSVPFSLELVASHYLRDLEQKADSLSALQELQRVLPHARNPQESVRVIEAMIERLSNLGDEIGREAWEDKILREFKTETEACANVHLERGLRAFAKRDLPNALVLFRKVSTEFPETAAYGDAQFGVGLVLQQQQKFDEAIPEFQKLFPSKVNDRAINAEKGEDYKNYRHRAALSISECFTAKKDFVQALDYVKQARDRYTFASFCKNCVKENKEYIEQRIQSLQAAIDAQKSEAKKPN